MMKNYLNLFKIFDVISQRLVNNQSIGLASVELSENFFSKVLFTACNLIGSWTKFFLEKLLHIQYNASLGITEVIELSHLKNF